MYIYVLFIDLFPVNLFNTPTSNHQKKTQLNNARPQKQIDENIFSFVHATNACNRSTKMSLIHLLWLRHIHIDILVFFLFLNK